MLPCLCEFYCNDCPVKIFSDSIVQRLVSSILLYVISQAGQFLRNESYHSPSGYGQTIDVYTQRTDLKMKEWRFHF